MIDELLTPGLLPLVLTGAAFLALAAWLALLGIGDRVSRAFAALLTFLGLGTLLGALIATGPPPEIGRYFVTLQPYALIPTAFFLVLFLSLFPRRRGLLGRSRIAVGAFALAGVALCLWYLLDHGAYATVQPAGDGAPTAGRGFRFTDYGPLAIFLGIRRPLLALAAVVLARDYQRDPSGSGGYSTFLIFAGFAINAVFDGVTFTTNLAQDLALQGSDVWQPGAWMQLALPALTLPLAIVAVVYIGLAIRHERGDATLQEARRFLLYALPAVVLSGFFISYRPWAPAVEPAVPFLLGIWRLVVPLLLAYGLLRYSLFSIDIRIKAGVKRAILVALFVGVFFLISEAAEALVLQMGGGLVSDDLGVVFGIASAAGLAVLGKPIQRLADRAANGVMPDTQPIEKLGSQARFRLYRDQFLLVQQDDRVSGKERRMLTRLAAVLAITEDEAMDLEVGEMPPRDEPAPPRPKRSVSTVARSVVAVLGTAGVFGAVSAILETLANPSSFATGLVTAAFVALLLGPIESLSERVTRRRKLNPAKEQAMRDALADAWADGNLSDRDEAFLAALQKRLGVSKAERKRIETEMLGAQRGPGAQPASSQA